MLVSHLYLTFVIHRRTLHGRTSTIGEQKPVTGTLLGYISASVTDTGTQYLGAPLRSLGADCQVLTRQETPAGLPGCGSYETRRLAPLQDG